VQTSDSPSLHQMGKKRQWDEFFKIKKDSESSLYSFSLFHMDFFGNEFVGNLLLKNNNYLNKSHIESHILC
jgi:hypothetical protein